MGERAFLFEKHEDGTTYTEIDVPEGQRLIWRSQRMRGAWTNNAQGYMSTPVVIDGHRLGGLLEPQAGSAEFPGGGGIRLAERLEQLTDLLVVRSMDLPDGWIAITNTCPRPC